MYDKLTLPAFGALAFASAVALGVHLGDSAIDQINPIHFQGAAVHPRDRGAAVAERLAPRTPAFAEHYGWEEGSEARSSDCNGCESLAARDRFSRSGPAFAMVEPQWETAPQPAVDAAEAQGGPVEQPEPFTVEWAEVDRYASFPVEAVPEQEAAAGE